MCREMQFVELDVYHRHAAAGADSVQPSLHGPVDCIPAGIGPEGVRGHGAAGGPGRESENTEK